jgi:hypothetical protein
MDLFMIQVDGVDIAIADSETVALDRARWLAADDPFSQIQVIRIGEGWTELIPLVSGVHPAR